MRRPAVFLDRDGTLNVEREGALRDPRELELIPGSAEAVARLAQAGFAVVVVTNQSAVGRGWMTLEELAAVHAELLRQLALAGGRVDAIHFCPHHPTEGRGPFRTACACRKPAPGMFLSAIEELDLDPERSWAIGDARRDVEAARAAGLRTLMVATGKGSGEHAALLAAGGDVPPCFADLAAAVDHLLAAAAAPHPEDDAR